MRCGRLGYSAIVGDITCFEPPDCSKANRSYEAIRFCGTKPSLATSLDATIRLMLGNPAHRSSSIIRPKFGIFGRLTLTFCRGLFRTVRLISWVGKRAKLAWDSIAATSDPCSVFREVASLSLAADVYSSSKLGILDLRSWLLKASLFFAFSFDSYVLSRCSLLPNLVASFALAESIYYSWLSSALKVMSTRLYLPCC